VWGVRSKSLPKRRILGFGFAVHIFTTKKSLARGGRALLVEQKRRVVEGLGARGGGAFTFESPKKATTF
jgi:hypothetical protein